MRTKKPKKIVRKRLDDVLEIGGFQHKLIKREGQIAIYDRARIKKPWCQGYEAGFEVIVVQGHDGYELGGQWLEATEIYPGASLFGIYGWSYQLLSDAEMKFNELQQTRITANEDTQPGTGDE